MQEKIKERIKAILMKIMLLSVFILAYLDWASPEITIFPILAVKCLYSRITKGTKVTLSTAIITLPLQWCISEKLKENRIHLMNVNRYFSLRPRITEFAEKKDPLHWFYHYFEASKAEKCVSVRSYYVGSVHVNEAVSHCKEGHNAIWRMPDLNLHMIDCICSQRDLESDRKLIAALRPRMEKVTLDMERLGRDGTHPTKETGSSKSKEMDVSAWYVLHAEMKMCAKECGAHNSLPQVEGRK